MQLRRHGGLTEAGDEGMGEDEKVLLLQVGNDRFREQAILHNIVA